VTGRGGEVVGEMLLLSIAARYLKVRGGGFNHRWAAAWAGLYNFAARERSHYHCPTYAVPSRTGGEPSYARGL